MIIDLEPILSGKKDEIIINTNLDIPSNLLEKSRSRINYNVI